MSRLQTTVATDLWLIVNNRSTEIVCLPARDNQIAAGEVLSITVAFNGKLIPSVVNPPLAHSLDLVDLFLTTEAYAKLCQRLNRQTTP